MRTRHHWCPACGCDVSAFVRKRAAEELERMSKRGGDARAKALTPERRSEIARKAATAKWERQRSEKKA
jgi:general stress protein YciG